MSNQQTVIMVPAKAVRQDLKTETKTIVYMPLATTHNPGVVKISNDLSIDVDGLLTLNLNSPWYMGINDRLEAVINNSIQIGTSSFSFSTKSASFVNDGDIAIGGNAITRTPGSIAIGRLSDSESVAVGVNSFAILGSTALGDEAKASAGDSIQLGRGVNTSNGTLQVRNFNIMSSDGRIKTNVGTTNSPLMKDVATAEDVLKNTNDILNKLDNYYTKNEVYTKNEIHELIVPVQGLTKEIVDDLPTENIKSNVLYLVRKKDAEGNNYFDEYLYVEDKWELVGTTETSLDNYVQFTNYASTTESGVVKVLNSYGSQSISGFLATVKATNEEIEDKTQAYKPIVPANLDYAVRIGLTTNTNNLTNEEKESAQSWLGVNNKLDKVTPEFDSGATRGYVYYINTNKEQTVKKVQIQANNDTIPLRDHTGNFYVNDPVQVYHVANKRYVDNKFEGVNKAVSFVNYSEMITSLNTLEKTNYNVGQNIMIVTIDVPDLWVSEIAEESVAYTYVSDDDFVNDLTTNGSVQVGYYKLSPLETQKVDLTNYIEKTTAVLRLYGTDANGNNILWNIRNTNSTANTIAGRDSYGNIQVGVARSSSDATNKKYVDDVVEGVSSHVINIDDVVTTTKFEGVVTLSESQYADLINNGSIVVGEQTITYSEGVVYITTDTETDSEKLDRLETTLTELTPDIMRALKTPLSRPTTTKLVAVDNTNSQQMLTPDEDMFDIENDTLKLKQSKNLFNIYRCAPFGLSQGNATIDYENKTITYTNATGADQYGYIQELKLKPNTTYTFSVKSTGIFEIYISIEGSHVGGGATTNYGSQSFTTGVSGIVGIRLDNELGAGLTNVFSEFMLNEGDTALPYEDYYGEIIHENYFASRTKIGKGINTFDNDFVIDSYVSSDGSTWYRRWASGWKECGSTILASMSNGPGQVISLPITFSNTNYFVCYGGTGDISGTETAPDTVKYVDISITPINESQIKMTTWQGFNRQYYACGY